MRIALRPFELALGGLCALLAAAVVYESAAPLPILAPPAIVLPQRAPPKEIVSFVPPSEAALSVIDARPLFNPARTPIIAAPPAGPMSASAPPPLPDVTLVGVIIDGSRQLALLKSEGAPFATSVSVGATVGGWEVSRIAIDSIVLRAGSVEQVLQMSSKRPPQPSQPATPYAMSPQASPQNPLQGQNGPSGDNAPPSQGGNNPQ